MLNIIPFQAAEAKERQVLAGKMYGEKHPQELKNNCSEALDEKKHTGGKLVVKNNCSEPPEHKHLRTYVPKC